MADEEIQKLPNRIRDHIRVIGGEPTYVSEYEGEKSYYALDSEFVQQMIVVDRIMRENEEVLRKLANS